MTEAELHWVAGLLEGEGCFSVKVDSYVRLEIRCNMTDEDVIYRLRETVGVGNVRGPIEKRTRNGVAKPQWLWTLGRRDGAEELMSLLLPLMGARRSAKIRFALEQGRKYPAISRRHGTVHMYEKYGCRCDQCRAALAAKLREYRSTRLKGKPPLRHGTRNAYERHQCRCDECIAYMISVGRLKRAGLEAIPPAR